MQESYYSVIHKILFLSEVYCFRKRGVRFMYMTVKQAAEKWGISDRRVCI